MKLEWVSIQLVIRLATQTALPATLFVEFTLVYSAGKARKFVLTRLNCKLSWIIMQLKWLIIFLITWLGIKTIFKELWATGKASSITCQLIPTLSVNLLSSSTRQHLLINRMEIWTFQWLFTQVQVYVITLAGVNLCQLDLWLTVKIVTPISQKLLRFAKTQSSHGVALKITQSVHWCLDLMGFPWMKQASSE